MYRLYWGDLHNHNAVGYGRGSLERSIEIAREHLDFFAFTGHASWHDMPEMPGDHHLKWVHGFAAHAAHWPRTRGLIADATTADFVAILGYEWHSSRFGDHCMLFAKDQPELYLPGNVEKLQDFAAARGALAIPHHVGYVEGRRGASWQHFRTDVSPVVEVFSEHGCTESDRAPFPMLRHSMGGRSTSNTIQPQLRRGRRFGLVASSDNHRGYPGAYGEGVVGVWATELSADALFAALRARRTYAATGDRIVVDFRLNGQPMGAALPATGDREIDLRVEGQDAIAMVELRRNDRVIERYFPGDHAPDTVELPGTVKCRIQYGWGAWSDLGRPSVCRWQIAIGVMGGGGRFRRATGCFQSVPFGEELRDHVRLVSDQEIRVDSVTTRDQCFAEDPTKAVVCELDGGPDTVLELRLQSPVQQTVRACLADLADNNVVTFTGGFTSASHIIHRLVGPAEFSASIRWHDSCPAASGADWYQVRVTQHNGHMAWSSPIWVGDQNNSHFPGRNPPA